MAVAPVLILLLLETALRLAGYGYDPRFLVPAEINGRRVLIQNDDFARRFFPAGVLRRPLPTVITRQKEQQTCRIVVLGESAAMGDPDPAFSFGRVLEALLRQRYPEVRFELVNLAFTAINSHAIAAIARESARIDTDFWVVYMGNNEMQGSFGAGGAFGHAKPGWHAIQASLWLRTTRIGQLLDSLGQRVHGGQSAPGPWEGLRMFVEHQVPPDSPAREAVYSNFYKNLLSILASGERSGATVLLSTVASNLRDFAPFASQHHPHLGEAQRAKWHEHYSVALELERSGECKAAAEAFSQAARVDPFYADLQFRLGRCQMSLGQTSEAVASFRLARDYDALPLRTDSRLNSLIGEAAAQRPHVISFDAEEAISRSIPAGIPGAEFFFEHVHFTFDGNYALALAMAEQVRSRLPDRVVGSGQGSWLSQDQCARVMGWTLWHDIQARETMLRRISDAPFTNTLNHAGMVRLQTDWIARLRSQLTPAAIQEARAISEAAARAFPDDYLAHESHARLLEGAGDLAGALQAWQRVAGLVPQYPVAHYHVGRFLSVHGQMAEAREAFRKALNRRPDFPEARNEFGLMLLREQRPTDAMPHFERAIELNPELMEARMNLGLALHRTGRTNEAVTVFEDALLLRPNSPQVQSALASFFMEQRNPSRAAVHYRELLRLQPNNPAVHMRLANALVAIQQRDEAVQHLRLAVELRPTFWEARFLLGVELAAQNRFHEAETQFAEVARANPNHVAAHLNRAVALVKQERFAEAMPHLLRVLELEPDNQKARQYHSLLQRALARPVSPDQAN
jgi:tetratricopeptide (TPR) repeat protein